MFLQIMNFQYFRKEFFFSYFFEKVNDFVERNWKLYKSNLTSRVKGGEDVKYKFQYGLKREN